MNAAIPNEVLDRMAVKFRIFADPIRLGIFRVLLRGERNVGQVVEETGQAPSTISRHLKMMTAAGLAGRRRQGSQVLYRLEAPLVEAICNLACPAIHSMGGEGAASHRRRSIGRAGKHD